MKYIKKFNENVDIDKFKKRPNETFDELVQRLKNDPEYKKISDEAEAKRKTDSDEKHFTFKEIEEIVKKLKGASIFVQNNNKYGNYEYILFHKYTEADAARQKLIDMGYKVSKREQNVINTYYKFKIYISKF